MKKQYENPTSTWTELCQNDILTNSYENSLQVEKDNDSGWGVLIRP